MKTRFLSATVLSLTFGLVPAASALPGVPATQGDVQACGDDHKDAAKPVPANALTMTLKVGGMSCDGCANGIRNALLKVEGVYDAKVSFESGLATVQVDGTKVDEAKLSDVIVKAGYTIEKPSKG